MLKLKNFILILLLTLFIGVIISCEQQKSADFVLMNGKFVTMDAAKPQAQALAAKGNILQLAAMKKSSL